MRTGLIVDGPGDFAALKTRFIGDFKILKTDGPRGHAVTVSQIVVGSRKQIGILKSFGCERVVIVTDFETRTDDYDEFCGSLDAALKRLNEDVVLLSSVPNRMIENWYLADISYLASQKSFLKSDVKQRGYEGSHGKNELKKLFASGITYSEVKHGPQLFAVVRFDEARRNSPSFHRFLELVEP
jgi:hypothetical protein